MLNINFFISLFFNPKIVLRFLRGKDPSAFDLHEIQKYLISQPDLIIEAGAYNGNDTIKMTQFWPFAKIYAFEPVPELFKKLSDKTSDCKNVKLCNSALSNSTNSYIEINTFDSDLQTHGSSSILKPSLHLDLHPKIRFEKRIKVPNVQLDEWALKNRINKIDVLWLDLQGAELEVLRSGTKCLEFTRLIHIEVSLKELYEGAAIFSEIKEFLEKFGFKLLEKRIPNLSGNAIFLKPNN